MLMSRDDNEDTAVLREVQALHSIPSRVTATASSRQQASAMAIQASRERIRTIEAMIAAKEGVLVSEGASGEQWRQKQ